MKRAGSDTSMVPLSSRRRRGAAAVVGVGLDRHAAVPLHRQLYAELREAIVSGRLRAGVRLPSSRALAVELGVSRNTVAAALEKLVAEGDVESRLGAGSYVSPDLPGPALSRQTRGEPSSPAGLAHAATPPAALSARGQLMSAARPRPMPHAAFTTALPDLDGFPSEVWGRLVARSWRRPPRELLVCRDPFGWPPLRRAIADHLRAARAVDCEPGQVMIVSGAQAGLDLAARLLLDPGDAAWIEEPGYGGIRSAIAASGAQAVPVPVDAEGLSVADGRRLAPAARLAAVSPSHQYPLGVTMSLARRLALIEWAGEAGAWVIEDDYNSEYRYAGRPLAAMQGLDRAGRVIYVGSFSKVMFPSLRVGWLVLPPALVEPFARARAAVDDHPSIVAQPALAAFVEDGHLAAHIRRTRERYRARQAALVEAAQERLTGLLELPAADAGMHLVGRLAGGLDDRAAVAEAAREQVSVAALTTFHAEPDAVAARRGLVLGYAAADEDTIRAGVVRLARALERLALTGAGRAPSHAA